MSTRKKEDFRDKEVYLVGFKEGFDACLNKMHELEDNYSKDSEVYKQVMPKLKKELENDTSRS